VAGDIAFALHAIELEKEKSRTSVELGLANRKLNLLTGIVRHEMHNQLTIVKGYQDLAEELSKNEKQERYISGMRIATENIERLLHFSKDYQDLGMVEAGWMDAQEILRDSITSLNTNGLVLDSNIEGLEVFADPLVEKVFHNLVENVMRHAKGATRVDISWHETADGATIVIEDDGPGIPEREKERIFEMGSGKNTGYGLHLVREILSITGMTIRESGSEGEGARFEMDIPAENYRRIG